MYTLLHKPSCIIMHNYVSHFFTFTTTQCIFRNSSKILSSSCQLITLNENTQNFPENQEGPDSQDNKIDEHYVIMNPVSSFNNVYENNFTNTTNSVETYENFSVTEGKVYENCLIVTKT